jgi:poly(A) polymerase
VLQQPRFKAGYDFLLLRAESGEVEPEVGDVVDRFPACQRRGSSGHAVAATARRGKKAPPSPGASLPE